MLKLLNSKKLRKRNEDFLDIFLKKSKIAEIGVHLASYSKIIYERCNPEELHLIDAWDYIPINPPAVYFDIPGRYEIAKSKFKKSDRVFFISNTQKERFYYLKMSILIGFILMQIIIMNL